MTMNRRGSLGGPSSGRGWWQSIRLFAIRRSNSPTRVGPADLLFRSPPVLSYAHSGVMLRAAPAAPYSWVPETLDCGTAPSDRALHRVLKIRWEAAKRAGSCPRSTLARRASMIATAAPCGQAPRAASLVHSRGSSPLCEPDGELTRPTSSFTRSREFGCENLNVYDCCTGTVGAGEPQKRANL